MIQLPEILPEKIWLSFDWAQAELYALCLFSKDEALKSALLSQDVHRYVIHRLYDISMDDVSPEQRNLSKLLSFSLIYSGFDLDTCRSIVFKRSGGTLEMDQIDAALTRYQEEFHGLFDWVTDALMRWHQSGGEVRYLFGARKLIRYPDYLKADLTALRKSRSGRVAINTYGQNSVGLLLKYVLASIYRDSFLRETTSQYIPIFDALAMLVQTQHVGIVHKHLNRIATPILRFEGFEIQMKAEWKIGIESWGQSHLINYVPPNSDPIILEWEPFQASASSSEPLSTDSQNILNPFCIT